MKDNNDIDDRMIHAVSSDLSGVTVEYAEMALDHVVDKVADDIPVIKTIVGLWKAGRTVRDAFLIKKILTFLYEIKDTTMEDRQKFIDQLGNAKYQEHVGEQIIIYLDRLDHITKAKLMARAIKLAIKKECDTETVLRLWSAIERIDILNIESIRSIYQEDFYNKPNRFRSVICQNIAMAGLLTMSVYVDAATGDEDLVDYLTNDLGKIFLRLLDPI